MKTGLKKYNIKVTRKNKSEPIDFETLKYDYGITTFVFILIVYAIVLTLGLTLKSPQKIVDSNTTPKIILDLVKNTNQTTNVLALKWQDAFLIANVAGVCLNGFWFLSRVKIGLNSKFKMLKYIKKLKIDHLIFLNQDYRNELAINNIENEVEYEIYFDIKKNKSRIMFYFSLSLFLVLLIISIILSFVIK